MINTKPLTQTSVFSYISWWFIQCNYVNSSILIDSTNNNNHDFYNTKYLFFIFA